MNRSTGMRLALAAVALLVGAGPGWAAAGKCMMHAHKGAVEYKQEGDFGPMIPQKHVGPHADMSMFDDEVAYIDKITPGGPWVIPLRSLIFRRFDVDLYGDCAHVPSTLPD